MLIFCPARLIIQLKLSVEAKSSFIFVLEKGRPHLRRAHLPAEQSCRLLAFCRRARRAKSTPPPMLARRGWSRAKSSSTASL